MATVTQDDVLSVLKRMAAPDGRGNVVSAGLVSDIAIQGGTPRAIQDQGAPAARAA